MEKRPNQESQGPDHQIKGEMKGKGNFPQPGVFLFEAAKEENLGTMYRISLYRELFFFFSTSSPLP